MSVKGKKTVSVLKEGKKDNNFLQFFLGHIHYLPCYILTGSLKKN